MSFLLNKEKVLFSGDIILGSPSTVVEDLTVYMYTLFKLRDNFSFDWICTTHSTSLEDDACPESIMMDGPSKLGEYIKYRVDRLNLLE